MDTIEESQLIQVYHQWNIAIPSLLWYGFTVVLVVGLFLEWKNLLFQAKIHQANYDYHNHLICVGMRTIFYSGVTLVMGCLCIFIYSGLRLHLIDGAIWSFLGGVSLVVITIGVIKGNRGF